MATATRFLGHCQICEKEQKLHEDRLVHHGYLRPGWGEIVGDCMGVAEEPYEVSCEACKRYLKDVVRPQMDRVQSFLAQLQSGELTELTFSSMYRTTTVKKSEVKDFEWTQALARKTRETEWSLNDLKREVERIENRIATWAPGKVRTFEEQLEEVAKAKAERASVVAAKRAERAAKETAKKERKAALEARRAAEKAAMFAKARELAAQDKPSPKAMEKLRKDIRKAVATWLWSQDFAPVATELKHLGIMAEDGRLSLW